MKTLAQSALALPLLLGFNSSVAGQPLNLDLEKVTGSWQTVVDGVMGGRSTGNITRPQPGVLRFSGELSLENNGGFSQMRTSVSGGSLAGAEGIVLECMGDGRTYNFDIRCSNLRLMAGSYQQRFETRAGEWTKVRLPLEAFEAYSFGRRLRAAPALQASKINSIGVTLSDKQSGPFELKIRSLTAFNGVQEVAAESTGETDLVSVARSAGLERLLAAVEAAAIELPDTPVTILAPTDAAFEALPEAARAMVEANPTGVLRTVLSYHMLDGVISSSEVLNRRSLETFLGQQVAVDLTTQTVGGAGLVVTDVPFDGGIVHVIDRVLLPELRSIVEIAAETEQLKTLVAATQAADLAKQLGPDGGPWTVFAPVNSAFAKLPKGAVSSLLEPENIEQLTEVLGLHVVAGRIPARELLSRGSLTTLLGTPIGASLEKGKIVIGGARLLATDIQASNGVVHLIDSVITGPPRAADSAGKNKGRGGADVYAEVLSIYGLAVKRGVALFNAGEQEACTAIYEVAAESIIRLGRGRLDAEIIERLQESCDDAAEEETWRARAWAYRRALDRVYRSARRKTPPA